MSYFYTDSITDLDLLELVGHQVVVNPDPLLKREAAKRGWPIINFKPLNPEG
jgi:phosphoserine phosphatase